MAGAQIDPMATAPTAKVKSIDPSAEVRVIRGRAFLFIAKPLNKSTGLAKKRLKEDFTLRSSVLIIRFRPILVLAGERR